MDAQPWYGVRCVIQMGDLFEERVTLWLATDLDDAIAKAEAEAREYAGIVGGAYLGLAQAFHLAAEELESGVEVFSLIRQSPLSGDDYLAAYFDTGTERQR